MAVEIYSDIDELVEIGHRLGFKGGGAQLKPGAIIVRRRSWAVGDVTLVRHNAHGAIDYWGDTPNDKFTFILPLRYERYRVNIESPCVKSIFVLPPDTEFSITTYGHDQFLLFVPVSLLKRHLNAWSSVSLNKLAAVSNLRIGQVMHAQLVDLLAVTNHGLGGHVSTENLEHQICEALATMLRSAASERNESVRIEAKMKAIRRARDFIAANLASPIVISEVSAFSGVSERTLQRLFREKFHLGPQAYIRSQRLEAVRKVLSQTDPSNRSISKIAYEHGFSHAGRFATEFKRQFGVLPKEFGCNRE